MKDKFIITNVNLRLSKKHQLNSSYGDIDKLLKANGISEPNIRDISHTIIKIRQRKLPDPVKIGNAGSFFKNPFLDKVDFEGLKFDFTDIPGFPVNDRVKVPAAWLIEQCGWKGKRFGAVGVHEKQPLVIVNYADGTGDEIKILAHKIKESVADKFGIELEPEPRII